MFQKRARTRPMILVRAGHVYMAWECACKKESFIIMYEAAVNFPRLVLSDSHRQGADST